MANMSYVRFENTVVDLRDCSRNIHDRLMDREARARLRLIQLCKDILSDVAIRVDVHGEPQFREEDEEDF